MDTKLCEMRQYFKRHTLALENRLKATEKELRLLRLHHVEDADLANTVNKHEMDSAKFHQRQVNRRLILQEHQEIAFSSYLSHHAEELGLHHTVPFDTVFHNDGNAFDPLLHVFTCPVTGVYVFMTAVLAEQHQNTVTEIVINGKPLVQAYSAGSTGSHGYDQGFNNVITNCNAGDRVWVQIHDHQGTTIFSGGFSTFSGYQLY